MGKGDKELLLSLRKADREHDRAMDALREQHRREIEVLHALEIKNALTSIDGRLATTNEWRATYGDMIQKVMGFFWIFGGLIVLGGFFVAAVSVGFAIYFGFKH